MNDDQSIPLDETFGAVDAWTEKPLLEKVFVKTKQSVQLTQKNEYFLFGRRGSGKSAIAIELQKFKENTYFSTIQGEVQTYGTFLNSIEKLESGTDEVKSKLDIETYATCLWIYYINVIFMNAILNESEIKEKFPNEYLKIDDYLSEKDLKYKEPGWLIYTIHLACLKKAGDNHDYNETLSFINHLINDHEYISLLELFPVLLQDKQLYVVFDSLDSYRIYSSYIKKTLKGIIKSITYLMGQRYHCRSSIKMLMPAEIYDEIADKAFAKVYDQSKFLRWHSGSLFLLLALRHLNFVNENRYIDENDFLNFKKYLDILRDGKKVGLKIFSEKDVREKYWYENRFLPSKITNKYGVKEDTLAYILRHTHRRPRDLIIIFKSIVSLAVQRNEMPFISESTIREGIHEESTLETIVNDLLSPYKDFYLGIADMAKTMFFGKPRVMTGDQLQKFSRSLYDLGKKMDDFERNNFISFLLRAGIVGYVKYQEIRDSNKMGFCPTYYEYLMQGNLPFSKDLTYYIHPAVGDILDMIDTPEYGVAYPIPRDSRELEFETNIGIPV